MTGQHRLAEDELRAGLARLATYAPTPHDPSHLGPTADALRRARQLQFRRRAAAVVAAAASIAVVVPVGLTRMDSTLDHTRVDPATAPPSPAHSTSSRPTGVASPTITPGPVRRPYARTAITIDLGRLPRGEIPAGPWFADGKIHNGTSTTPANITPGQSLFDVVPDGYLIASSDNDQWRVQLIGLDGVTKWSASTKSLPVLSKSRQQVAWATTDGGVVVADTGTGTVQHSIHLADRARPVGFLGEPVLLTPSGDATSESGHPQVWDPPTGHLTSWNDAYQADSTNGRVLAGVVPNVAHDVPLPAPGALACAAGVDTSAGNREKWRVCTSRLGSTVRIRSFSPTGRYAVLDVSGEGATLGDTTIADATTGRPVLTIKQHGDLIAWEDDQHFLLTAISVKPSTDAIVRCTVTGTCELATEPTPTATGTYQLAGR